MIKQKNDNTGSNTTLLLEDSIGYHTRQTHRLLQKALQKQIEPAGISVGMWYFLRALWEEDGQTQSQLSRRVGTTEPTTLNAIRSMEKAGLIVRTQSQKDLRKINIFLTARAKNLEAELVPKARMLVDGALSGVSEHQQKMLFKALEIIQRNIEKQLAE